MVFFVRITVNQSHLRPICKSTKFNPKIQRTIYLINFQQLRLHVPDFIRTVVVQITNVVEHAEDFSTTYYMRTSGTFSYIKVYVNSNGFITYAKPMSLKGKDDGELSEIIEIINSHFV